MHQMTLLQSEVSSLRKANEALNIYMGYIAISYVWGDPSPGGSIVLHGKPFAQTASLNAALRGVREASVACRVWVDALRINQANIAERNRQVRLMGSIY
ncbi:hypothetical protein N657DRAFT_679541 [Parathielavia appendiculata]|uniref:Heterokaryon incompatibility domain-containing protein n=1 Tax=Parathielavia appendiculata TaxID=2587402 RepID=A0AAN6U2F1_9PEZI|nr:hypothetical protein N657DRAFT_679541 [Parathielavia appendiculata]